MNLNTLLKNQLYLPPLSGEVCSKIIREELLKKRTIHDCAFGSAEIKTILFPQLPLIFKLFLRERVSTSMRDLSGFFPLSKGMIKQFSELMYEDMKMLVILGSWRFEEKLLLKFPFSKTD